jgi:hypothetical protein
LRLLKGLIFFGKRDLAFGINLPERSEIWKTSLGVCTDNLIRVDDALETPKLAE